MAVSASIPDPDSLPRIDLERRLETAFRSPPHSRPRRKVSADYGQIDGAGLSFGPAQVNFGTGTLPPLFKNSWRLMRPRWRLLHGSG